MHVESSHIPDDLYGVGGSSYGSGKLKSLEPPAWNEVAEDFWQYNLGNYVV